MAGGAVGSRPACRRRRTEWKLRNYGADIGEAHAASAGRTDGRYESWGFLSREDLALRLGELGEPWRTLENPNPPVREE